jgi:2-oxo-3-hexenedioate decarboxylase
MTGLDDKCSTRQISRETLDLLGTGRQVAPISDRCPDFGLQQAYEIVSEIAQLRRQRGENPVGRKIGFTNRAVWQAYAISGPIWNYMFDGTVHDLAPAGGTFSLKGLSEPRIEPEIVLHLSRAPEPGMDEADLMRCVDWVAHGFELVFSIFPGWRFTAADAAAAFGVHAAILLGDRHDVRDKPDDWLAALSEFTVELAGSGGATARGSGANVLGGPLKALQFLVEEVARFPACEPLRAGELITTGTLTEAMPANAGEVWSTSLAGIDMRGIGVTLAE